MTTQNTTPQELKRATVHGYKGIKGEVTIYPEGDKLVLVAGPNGAGKSSYLDAISEIFDPKGTKFSSIPRNLALGDEDECFAEIETDQIIARRTWKKNDAGSLSVRAVEGHELARGTAKELLGKMQGGAIFDSTAFRSLDAAKQRAEMLKHVALPFDLLALEADKKRLEAERAALSAPSTALAAQVAAFPLPEAGLPETETPSSAILAQLDQVRAHNARVAAVQQSVTATEASVAAGRDALQRAYDAYMEAKAHFDGEEVRLAAAREEVERWSSMDETELVASLATADETNAKVRTEVARQAAIAAHAAKAAEYAEKDAAVKALEQKKRDGLAAAEFPVDGWKVDDEGITKDGVPFKQLNSAQQIIGSFILSTLAKPNLRIVMMKEGDMLDDESLAGIRDHAEKQGYWVFTERDRDSSRGIAKAIFSAGEVVSA